MIKKTSRDSRRNLRHGRLRKKMAGNSDKLRACIFRSNRNLSIQFIDDETGKVITGFTTLNKEFKEKNKNLKNNVKLAKLFGGFVGQKAKERNITRIVFDRCGYKFHGKIKAVAEGIREQGIKF
jgi:large subunit ribosomal protein L18